MKLAEALSERADIQKRMQQLCARLRRNALVQEGEKPAEDPHALLEEYGRLCERYEELIRRTNLTNAATTDGGETLTALLARRDALIERISGLNDFLQEASNTAARATRSEIVIRSTVDVSALQKQADELSKQLRASFSLKKAGEKQNMKNPLKLRMRFSGSGSATGRASSPGGSKMPKSYWFAGSSEAVRIRFTNMLSIFTTAPKQSNFTTDEADGGREGG